MTFALRLWLRLQCVLKNETRVTLNILYTLHTKKEKLCCLAHNDVSGSEKNQC